MRSHMRFKWMSERSSAFVAHAFEVEPGVIQYETYFHADELHGWLLMAKIHVRQGGRSPPLRSTSSFVEHWSSRSRADGRWAQYGPSYVHSGDGAGDWIQVTEAALRHSRSATDIVFTQGNVTAQENLWELGIRSNVQSHVFVPDVLSVRRAFSYPLQLQTFDDLQRAGKLPEGCIAETCFCTLLTDWLRERLTLQGLPGTLALACSILSCCCGIILCHVCRKVPSTPQSVVVRTKLDMAVDGETRDRCGPCLLTCAPLERAIAVREQRKVVHGVFATSGSVAMV